MPRADITPARLHDVAVRATAAARQKVAAIIGRDCEEDIMCAFIDPLQPIRANHVVAIKVPAVSKTPAGRRFAQAIACDPNADKLHVWLAVLEADSRHSNMLSKRIWPLY